MYRLGYDQPGGWGVSFWFLGTGVLGFGFIVFGFGFGAFVEGLGVLLRFLFGLNL
jgi:hypothetical protein